MENRLEVRLIPFLGIEHMESKLGVTTEKEGK